MEGRHMSETIVFHGLDAAEDTLLRHAHELDYVLLVEVITRVKRTTIARVAFTPEALADWLGLGFDDEVEPEEDISDLPTVERTSGSPVEPTATHTTSLLAAATQDEEDLGEDQDEDQDDEQADDEPPTPRQMCRAVMHWVRHEAHEVVQGRPICTLRLMMYRPKGGYIESKNLKVENLGYVTPQARRAEEQRAQAAPPTAPPRLTAAPPPPLPTPPAAPEAPPPAPVYAAPPPQLPAVFQPPPPVVIQPLPVQVVLPTPAAPEPPRSSPAVAIALTGNGQGQLIYLDPETIPEARVWRALGRATEEFLGTVGKTYTGIIDLQARTVTHQAEQLDQSQALVQNLAGQLLAARQVQEADEAEQKVDERQLRMREELGKTFLSELGSLGRVLATSKLGAPPELLELGDLVASSPELAEAIRDPQVRAMLKDEKTRKELAQLLTVAARSSSAPANTTP